MFLCQACCPGWWGSDCSPAWPQVTRKGEQATGRTVCHKAEPGSPEWHTASAFPLYHSCCWGAWCDLLSRRSHQATQPHPPRRPAPLRWALSPGLLQLGATDSTPVPSLLPRPTPKESRVLQSSEGVLREGDPPATLQAGTASDERSKPVLAACPNDTSTSHTFPASHHLGCRVCL